MTWSILLLCLASAVLQVQGETPFTYIQTGLYHVRGGSSSFASKKLRNINPFRQLWKVLRTPGAAEQEYAQTLELNIQFLQSQILTLREESRQLRSLLGKSQSKSRSSQTSSVMTVKSHSEEIANLRVQLVRCQEQIQSLQKTEESLLDLLQMERKRVAELTALIDEQAAKIIETEERAKQEMEKMRRTLVEQSKLQMENMAKTVDKMMEADTARKQRETGILLENEKKKGEKAINAEKEKMRKLLKALAKKEKRNDLLESRRVETINQSIQQRTNPTKKLVSANSNTNSFGKVNKASIGPKSIRNT